MSRRRCMPIAEWAITIQKEASNVPHSDIQIFYLLYDVISRFPEMVVPPKHVFSKGFSFRIKHFGVPSLMGEPPYQVVSPRNIRRNLASLKRLLHWHPPRSTTQEFSALAP